MSTHNAVTGIGDKIPLTGGCARINVKRDGNFGHVLWQKCFCVNKESPNIPNKSPPLCLSFAKSHHHRYSSPAHNTLQPPSRNVNLQGHYPQTARLHPPDIIREQIPNKWEKLMSVLASVMREIPSEAAEDHQIREWMGQFEEVSAQIEELRQFTAGMSTEVPEYPEEAKEAVSSRLLTLAVLRNRLDGKAKVKAAPAAPRDPETGGEVRRSRRQQEKTAAEGGGSKSDHTGDPVVGHSTTLASRGKVAEGDTILPDTVTNMSDVEVGILQLPLCELSPEPVEVPQSINFLEPGSGELLFNATNFALGSGNLEDQLRFIPFCALLLFFFFPRLSPLILSRGL
ncbi:hypothetical protein EDD15DRAFT_2379030 [Pisolithus albus]|nr:hypothetical protein EDD15DRAFT_2379030 [Pisolithus albus]